jgi:hypothetical protein
MAEDLFHRLVRVLRWRRLPGYRGLHPRASATLVFEYVPRMLHGPPDEAPQSPRVETVAALFSDVDELYWLAIEADLGSGPRNDFRRDEDLTARVVASHFGSPFRIFLEVPPGVWAAIATTFVGALAAVFGAPAKFEESRARFWRNRLQADEAKRAWIESRQQANTEDGFRLVDVEFSEIEEQGSPQQDRPRT